MTAFHRLLSEELHAANTYPSSTGRQLLQYYDPYYDRGYNWSGGRIAGVIVGAVFFALAILFLIIAITLRRRRMASYQANNAYPAGTYPAAPYNQTYPQAYPQANQYPQASTYPNQAYPQNTVGYNPAPYNSGAAYPNTATGTPVDGHNGVQMSALPHEKPGY